jgi:hypothetical protein
MKKLIILFIILISTINIYGGYGGRYADRSWSVAQVSPSGNAQRVTIPKSGSLWIQANGADCYIAFNATANASSIKIADGSSRDFWPANLTISEYYTVYSAGAATCNYIITD